MKKFLVAALVLLIVATLVNDAGRYLRMMFRLDTATQEIVRIAADAAPSERGKSQPGGRAAVRAAQERGLVVYGYQIEGNEVQVWTQAMVDGTWIYGPFLAWQAGKPLDTPLEITDHKVAFVR
ncbi:MAG: hypothetical protein IBX62_03835 [Coriobacteriia bacterium]|nr:hypothetical protein [Coriobacteriia bacterium]